MFYVFMQVIFLAPVFLTGMLALITTFWPRRIYSTQIRTLVTVAAIKLLAFNIFCLVVLETIPVKVSLHPQKSYIIRKLIKWLMLRSDEPINGINLKSVFNLSHIAQARQPSSLKQWIVIQHPNSGMSSNAGGGAESFCDLV